MITYKFSRASFDGQAVVLANGSFPSHPLPLEVLDHAREIYCCDGALVPLLARGLHPRHIIGDLDSLPQHLALLWKTRLHHDPSQETNDLTKAIRWCAQQGIRSVVILGATGLREDHTIGNVALLTDFTNMMDSVVMLTDTGIITPTRESPAVFESFEGQQVSIFTTGTPSTITTTGLRYPLHRRMITRAWEATLNEAIAERFTIEFNTPLIVFQTHKGIH